MNAVGPRAGAGVSAFIESYDTSSHFTTIGAKIFRLQQRYNQITRQSTTELLQGSRESPEKSSVEI
jgi:hypothetical protein